MAGPKRFVESAAAMHGLPPAQTASLFSRLFTSSSSTANADVPNPADSDRLAIPKFGSGEKPPGTEIDLATTLQYGQVTGLQPLADFIKEFTLEHVCGGRVPYAGVDTIMTCGNTDGFSKVMALFAEPGKTLLVEEFCYTNAVQSARPLGINVCPVKMDEGSMRPDDLAHILDTWDEAEQGRKPSLMYTVTIGQNPSGATLSLARRQAIYEVCDRHDVIIIEDDPYWHLQYTPESHPDTDASSSPSAAKYPFLDALTPSFLTIDVSGRVLRLDTFSKTIAPGCRLGWITAQPAFIERLQRTSEGSTQQPSGFVQAAVATLLLRTWGMDGWVAWLSGLRDVYERRMRLMCDALSAGSFVLQTRDDGTGAVVVRKKPLFEFHEPDGGMFTWVRVRIADHPAFSEYTKRGYTKANMMSALWDYAAITRKTLPSPGSIFGATPQIEQEKACEYFRFCFAAIDEPLLASSTKLFTEAVKQFWTLNADDIEGIDVDQVTAQLSATDGKLSDLGGLAFGC